MNSKQKAAVWVGVLLIAAMGLYPPWTCIGGRGIGTAAGYHWLFLPPSGECFAVNVDFPRLLIQWVIVAGLAAASCWAWPVFPAPSWLPAAMKTAKRVLGVIYGIAAMVLLFYVVIYVANYVAPAVRAVATFLGVPELLKTAGKLIESPMGVTLGLTAIGLWVVVLFVKGFIKGYRRR